MKKHWVVETVYEHPFPDGKGSHEWVSRRQWVNVIARREDSAKLCATAWLKRTHQPIRDVTVESVLSLGVIDTTAESEGIDE